MIFRQSMSNQYVFSPRTNNFQEHPECNLGSRSRTNSLVHPYVPTEVKCMCTYMKGRIWSSLMHVNALEPLRRAGRKRNFVVVTTTVWIQTVNRPAHWILYNTIVSICRSWWISSLGVALILPTIRHLDQILRDNKTAESKNLPSNRSQFAFTYLFKR